MMARFLQTTFTQAPVASWQPDGESQLSHTQRLREPQHGAAGQSRHQLRGRLQSHPPAQGDCQVSRPLAPQQGRRLAPDVPLHPDRDGGALHEAAHPGSGFAGISLLSKSKLILGKKFSFGAREGDIWDKMSLNFPKNGEFSLKKL